MATSSTASAGASGAKKAATRNKPLARRPAAKTATPRAAKPAAKAATPAARKPASKVGAAPVKTSAVPLTPVDKQHQSVVRDSFTMTVQEEALLKLCKREAIALGRETKKSEVLRAAIQHFVKLSATERNAAYGALEAIKTGRPKKAKR